MKPQPLTAASAALGLFVSLLWGGNVVAIKFALTTVPPFWSAFWRFASACAAVALWAWLQRVDIRPSRGDSTPVFLLGLMFTAQISCLNTGISLTSPAYAVVLLNSHPVWTNLLGHFYASEDTLNLRRLIGLALACAGILFVALGKPDAALAPRPWLGNILMMVSAILLAVRVIYTRRLVQAQHPLRPVIWQMVFSLPLFAAAAALAGEPPVLQPVTWPPAGAILYQGVVIGGFCFVTWTTLLRRHSASTLSMFGFLVPFFGVFLSALVFGEAIDPHLILGALLVSVGIIVVTRPARAAVETEPAEELQAAVRENRPVS